MMLERHLTARSEVGGPQVDMSKGPRSPLLTPIVVPYIFYDKELDNGSYIFPKPVLQVQFPKLKFLIIGYWEFLGK